MPGICGNQCVSCRWNDTATNKFLLQSHKSLLPPANHNWDIWRPCPNIGWRESQILSSVKVGALKRKSFRGIKLDLFPRLTPISFSFGRYVYEIIVTSCLHCLIPTATSKGISSTICNCTGLPPHSGIICSMQACLLISRRNGYEETEPTFTPTDGGPPSVEIHLQEGTAPFHTFLPTHSRTHYAGQHCWTWRFVQRR